MKDELLKGISFFFFFIVIGANMGLFNSKQKNHKIKKNKPDRGKEEEQLRGGGKNCRNLH